MKELVVSVLAVMVCSIASRAQTIKADVCIYGGTSAGVIAAEAVAKSGKSAILIEPGRHLGGLSSGGLGQTDIGNKMVIGGPSPDFYRPGRQHYRRPQAWQVAPRRARKNFHP